MSASKSDSSQQFRLGSVVYDFRTRTHIMGILNVTPDSFSDGGRYAEPRQAVDVALKMVDEGADIIDIGGESARPGSDPVSVEEELRRVLPVIEELSDKTLIPISIDTYKSEVADKALKAGACIVNDISGMSFDPSMASVVARYGATAVLMHMHGTPKTMQQDPQYDDVVREVFDFLERQCNNARSSGIQQLMIDPGLGFGKTLQHNIALMQNLSTFHDLGYPVLVGPSRKSFLGSILDLPVDERLEGTAAAVALCIRNGAAVVRVHDVKEMKRVALVADALKS
jgi:dihydropteroate synthase